MIRAVPRRKHPASLEMEKSNLLRIRLTLVMYVAITIGTGGLLSAPLATMRIVMGFSGEPLI
jgi:hypothetical protein